MHVLHLFGKYSSVDISMEEDIDLLAGFKSALENSKRLISCADTIATTTEYGPANSLLILAIEECAKAGFLIFCAISGNVSSVDLVKILRRHENKHYLGYVTRFMLEITGEIPADGEFKQRVEKHFVGIEQLDYESQLQRIGEFTGEMISDAMDTAQSRLSENEKIGDREWWCTANMQRNRGFYTDLDKNSWITPAVISKDDFEKTRKMAIKFLAEIESCSIKNQEGVSIMRKIVSAANIKLGSKEMALPDNL